MVWAKACPRCGGDLFEEHDWYMRAIKCFQCGRTLTPAQERALRAASLAAKAGEIQAVQEAVVAPPRKRRKAA